MTVAPPKKKRIPKVYLYQVVRGGICVDGVPIEDGGRLRFREEHALIENGGKRLIWKDRKFTSPSDWAMEVYKLYNNSPRFNPNAGAKLSGWIGTDVYPVYYVATNGNEMLLTKFRDEYNRIHRGGGVV